MIIMERMPKFRARIKKVGNNKSESKRWEYFYLWELEDKKIRGSGEIIEFFEQYTGLKDKNGKEIYEGDIVKRFKPHEFLKGVVETEVFRIRWGVKKAGFFAYNKTRKRHNQPAKRLNANDIYEVIGNIHENSGLLESIG